MYNYLHMDLDLSNLILMARKQSAQGSKGETPKRVQTRDRP